MISLEKLTKIRKSLREKKPLIHAITNPIAINMLANAILFQGASPICAEHPDEMADIIKQSDALSINLGNITKDRAIAMDRASFYANKKGIPIVIDLVGIGASKMRLDFSKNLLKNYKFCLIKGNVSEILSLAGLSFGARGVDVGDRDKKRSSDELIKVSSQLFKKYQTPILMTGAKDILLEDNIYYEVKNGTSELSKITATGCMLTGLISAFTSVADPISASLISLLILEIGSEKAAKDKPYTFFVDLMDNIGTISNKDIIERAKIRRGDI